MIKTEDYPLSRVPQDKKVSFFSVAIVYMGALTSLDQFMLGAVLGHSMTLTDAFTALFRRQPNILCGDLRPRDSRYA